MIVSNFKLITKDIFNKISEIYPKKLLIFLKFSVNEVLGIGSNGY